MVLKEVIVQPLKKTLEPELYVQAKFHYSGVSVIPLEVTGYLFINDIKISNFSTYEFGKGILENLVPMNQSREIDKEFAVTFLAPLSRQAIEELNSSRSKNPRGEVLMGFKFSFKCIESSFESMNLTYNESKSTVVTIPNGSLLQYRVYPSNYEVKISASDWLHDFYSHLGLGRFIVVELPIPELAVKTKKDNLNMRINEALQSFGEMRIAYEKMDWNLVIKESRPIWELNRKQAEISNLLKNEDYSEAAVQSFNALLQSLFDFSSKFIHKEDKSKEVMSYSKASKEDAVLVYSMAASILNLIGRKLSRIDS